MDEITCMPPTNAAAVLPFPHLSSNVTQLNVACSSVQTERARDASDQHQSH